MSATLQEVRTAIKAKLDGLTASGVDETKPLRFAYDYFKDAKDGYPYAMFEPVGLDSNVETTAENLRSFKFRIVIFQEMNTMARNTALDILVDTFDVVIDAFDRDWNLGGLIETSEAMPGEIYALDVSDGQVMVSEILYTCKVISPVVEYDFN